MKKLTLKSIKIKIMKKSLLVLSVTLFTIFSYSQNELEKAAEKLEKQKTETIKTETVKVNTQQSGIKEPEWIGQVVYVDNQETLELESQKAYFKGNESASVFIIGIGKYKEKWMVKGNKSSFRIKSNNNIKFIVNAGSNELNPKSVIKIVKLLTNKKNKRYYIESSYGTYTGSKSGDLDLVSFKAKKYGETSYEVLIPNVGDGEYAMIINDSIDWNLFGIE